MTISQNFPKVMVTGHRERGLSPTEAEFAKVGLRRTMIRFREAYGMQEAISGMALGVDTWWARLAVELGVPLAAYIPYPQQAERWSSSHQAEWEKLQKIADREVVMGDSYNVRLLFARNHAMLRDADAVVAVWRPSQVTGGTADAAKNARKVGKPMVLVNLDTMRIEKENF